MRKIIVVGLLAATLFGVSAGGSYFLAKMQREKAKAKTDETASADTPAKEKDKDKEAPPRRESAPTDLGGARPGLLARREGNPEADATVQQAARLRERELDVARREDAFRARVKNLDLIKQDILGGREDQDKLRREIAEEEKTAREALAEVTRRMRVLEEKDRQSKADLDERMKKITEVDSLRSTNIRRVGGISDTMDPASAAGIILSMADTGGLDNAALLLANMKDRKAAEVLSQLPDRTLAAQLIEKMLTIKQSNSAAPAPAGASSNGATPGRTSR